MDGDVCDKIFVYKSVSGVNESLSDHTDDYVLELRKLNLLPIIIPVLDFEFFNLDKFGELLIKPTNYSGLLLVSPRCVRGVAKACGKAGLLAMWHLLPAFAVGCETERLAKELLQLDTRGSSAGNGAALASIILQEMNASSLPLLMPCGTLKRDALEVRLAEGGVSCEVVPIYRTLAHPQLEAATVAALARGSAPSAVAFFSPSGLHAALPFLRIHLSCQQLLNIKWVAIGPTTADAMTAAGLGPVAIAAKPTAVALREALMMDIHHATFR